MKRLKIYCGCGYPSPSCLLVGKNTVECCLAYVFAYGVGSYGVTHCSFALDRHWCCICLLGVESYDAQHCVPLYLLVDR